VRLPYTALQLFTHLLMLVLVRVLMILMLMPMLLPPQGDVGILSLGVLVDVRGPHKNACVLGVMSGLRQTEGNLRLLSRCPASAS
jgi:hypothetical protein